MPLTQDQIVRFLKSVHPYDALPKGSVEELAPLFEPWEVEQDFAVYDAGEKLPRPVSRLRRHDRGTRRK